MKSDIARLCPAVEAGEFDGLTGAVAEAVSVNLAHPMPSGQGFRLWTDAIAGLRSAIPDLERRDMIRMQGRDTSGATWVGVMGYFVGDFQRAWLGIPPTRRMAGMRYHEFFRVDGGQIVEIQSLWDIPELMMQAGAWPQAPGLGRQWQVPGPATQDGLTVEGSGRQALKLVSDMLTALGRNRDGVAAMQLNRYWHPAMSWYGPAGIGTTRGIEGFRAHHQRPFLASMPDRQALLGEGHLFAEGDYVGFTAWPGMVATLTGAEWLGLPGAGQNITLRSLDFWRVEGGLIRENWVLVDLLDIYAQLGVDVMKRMRALH